MKLLTLLWCMVIFICTCTLDQSALIHHLEIYFRLDPHPHFVELLRMDDMYLFSSNWYLYKAGHFTLFAILCALALGSFENRKNALIFAILVAFATEILQLFFSRDGRLYDVVIDSTGALLSYFSHKY
ncbi:VanZ family protein [Paenibacillus sp. GP183]|jgi:VanZ family protein|uniref:VanZ family protein n=1 Tax=Paenibacillus sp. GP183 TaxID=1882751 RepID=UPI00089A7402|nr:VanZ family protein [Paenibacillus sp. GP183]SEC10847.1 VanZ like family protein [Paenibacillus sp. GP183]